MVTGHQLNLFTGPLYFAYKILTTIKLAAQLEERYPENKFVPVYWMGTEDHDFEEVNYSIERLISAFEIGIILAMGIGVGFIAMAILFPIFRLGRGIMME